jgi:large exoprotein involved in heme utilization and adhesion
MVEANSLNIDGGVYDKNEKFYWASKITASSWGQGDAGSINILADKLSVTDGGMIVALSNSSGTGGNIRIQSDSVVLNGAFSDPQNQYYPSAISSQTKATGQGGNIELITGSLEISEGAQIDTSSFGSGSAGKIAIDAQNIDLSGAFTNSKWLVPSSIASGSVQSGKGGNIDIHTSVLNIANGAAISVAGKTTGDGGDITIQADAISISGVAVNEILNASKSAGIYSNANDGNAGDITIKSTSLKIFDNGIIEAKTDGTGTGGNIIVDAKTIEMNSNAVISSASTGTGDAGSINLTVADKLEIRDSTITTESMLADGGDITITTTTTGFLTWLIDSSITATVGGGSQTTGGNIRINSPYVVLKDSHVIANAYEGKGGNIGITADTYLADWTSTVSASSALGISGQVDINSPIVNLSGLLSPLPTALVDITELLVSDCETRYKRRKASSLVVKGRDALPAQPGDLWPSPVMMQ